MKPKKASTPAAPARRDLWRRWKPKKWTEVKKNKVGLHDERDCNDVGRASSHASKGDFTGPTYTTVSKDTPVMANNSHEGPKTPHKKKKKQQQQQPLADLFRVTDAQAAKERKDIPALGQEFLRQEQQQPVPVSPCRSTPEMAKQAKALPSPMLTAVPRKQEWPERQLLPLTVVDRERSEYTIGIPSRIEVTVSTDLGNPDSNEDEFVDDELTLESGDIFTSTEAAAVVPAPRNLSTSEQFFLQSPVLVKTQTHSSMESSAESTINGLLYTPPRRLARPIPKPTAAAGATATSMAINTVWYACW